MIATECIKLGSTGKINHDYALQNKILHKLFDCYKYVRKMWWHDKEYWNGTDKYMRSIFNYQYPDMPSGAYENIFLDFEEIGYKKAIQIPLTYPHQRQLNNVFSKIHPLEFYPADIVNFYFGPDKTEKCYISNNIFKNAIFNPPKLPKSLDEKIMTLKMIAENYALHVNKQTLSIRECMNMKHGKCSKIGQFLMVSVENARYTSFTNYMGEFVTFETHKISCSLDVNQNQLDATIWRYDSHLPESIAVPICARCDNLEQSVKNNIKSCIRG